MKLKYEERMVEITRKGDERGIKWREFLNLSHSEEIPFPCFLPTLIKLLVKANLSPVFLIFLINTTPLYLLLMSLKSEEVLLGS